MTKPFFCALAATALAVLFQELIWAGAGAGFMRLVLRTGIAIIAYLLLTPLFVPLSGECLKEIRSRTRSAMTRLRGPALNPVSS
jgi:hypothetical protein